MTLLFPAHMVSILASLAGLHVTPASPYVVFHADWLLLLSKLDLAIVWYADLSFRLALAFPFEVLVLRVLVNRPCWAPCCIGLGLRRCRAGCWERHRHDVILDLWV